MRKRGNGEGTVFQRKDGLWCAQKYVIGRRLTAYGKDKTTAIRKLQEKITEGVKTGTITQKKSRITFPQWVPMYLERKKKTLRPLTCDSYELSLKRAIKYLGDIRVQQITSAVLGKLADELALDGYSASTINGTVTTTAQCVNTAFDEGVVDGSRISTKGRLKKFRGKYKLPPLEDVVRCISAIDYFPLRCFGLFCLYTGLRRGEALGVKWEDIDEWEGKVYIQRTILQRPHGGAFEGVPKNGVVGQFAQIPADGIEMIEDLREYYQRLGIKSPWLFFTPKGNYLQPNTVSHYMRKALAPVCEKGAIHLLRHMHATLLAKNRVPLRTISQQLRHSYSSIGVTNRYINEIVGESYDEITGISLPGCSSVAVADKKNKS